MATASVVALGRSAVYELLSRAFLYPEQGTTALLAEAARGVARVAAELEWREVKHALDRLGRQCRSLSGEKLVDDYTAIFGHAVSGDCPQYEGEYGQAHVFQKSQTLADLNTFYQSFGVAPNPELKERPDHISIEMEFMHLLTLKEAYAQLHGHGEEKMRLCREAQEAFLRRHLEPWILAFARQVRTKAVSNSAYDSLARLLEAHMKAEFQTFGIIAESSRHLIPHDGQEEGQDCEGCPVFSAVSPTQEDETS